MVEPSAIWSDRRIVFDKSISLTQQIILSHGAVALQSLIKRIDYLHELVVFWPALIDYHPHPEIPGTLSELAYHQGVASTILFNDQSRMTNENSGTYQLRMGRLAYVKAKCQNISTAVLADRKIRNSLTHVDEYLAKKLSRPKTGWSIDSAFGRRDQFTAKQHGIDIAFCRTYISSEDVLIHFDNEISISALRAEAVNVLRAIWNEAPHEQPEKPSQPPPNLEPKPPQTGA